MLPKRNNDWLFFGSILFLVSFGVFILDSLSKDLFPAYLLIVFTGFLFFIFFYKVGFEVISLFSRHFFILSIVLLLATFVIGQVTRGTVRWIPIGSFSFQPAEFVRPFILLFFANYLTVDTLKFKRLVSAILLLLVPVILILIEPSLGVTILTLVGFLGVLIASDFNKKYIFVGVAILAALLPLTWFIMQPYQKARITSFLNPEKDALGAGYNSIQSTISVGSGKILGRGLGKGVQTQLAFLPEKQTDFIFAAISEELGFVGTAIIITLFGLILWKLTVFMEFSVNQAGRAYLSGTFLTLLVQIVVHIGMNIGIFPVTGLPLPLVSAGGSSLISTMIALGIAAGARK